MIFFQSDYSQGAHPAVLKALAETNLEHTPGYGTDEHCQNAARMIRELCGLSQCSVHMMTGGTSCNLTFIAAALKPYESVIAARSGHIYVHETGAIEGTGHRVVTVEGSNGKLTPSLIDTAFSEYQDEHTAKPAMVYISQPTETGSLYNRSELVALFEKCQEKHLLLYVDGARLACALTSRENDVSLPTFASLCDAFYMGGTKNGALLGEALVIKDPRLSEDFRFMMKRQGGLLAKGRIIGVQFEALLKGGQDCLYLASGAHANALAEKLRAGLSEMGVSFYSDSPTNQIFPILPAAVVHELEKDFAFYEWEKETDGMIPIRLVTGWGTREEEADTFLTRCAALLARP